MCLIVFAWRAHPSHALVVAANRDEYYDRPTLPAAFWDDQPVILAGRDVLARGSWLGVTRAGRFASITNYRDPAQRNSDAPSRGKLVSDFLLSGDSPAAYFSGVAARSAAHNGFSMIAGDERSMCFFSNRENIIREIEPGVHGLSNHLLDTPWPKVEKSRKWLGEHLRRRFDAEDCLEFLADRAPAPELLLPNTGIGIERERELSPIRIVGEHYGTRCSSVVRFGTDGSAQFCERSYRRDGAQSGTVRFEFTLAAPGAR